jgi:predicted nucleic acid-binding protein
MAFVVDASVTIKVMGIGPEGDLFAPYLTSSDERHVPELFDVEVVAAIRHALMRSVISERRAAELVTDHLDSPMRRHRHLPLMPRAYELRSNVSVADGIYVALAEQLGVPLVTADARLATAVRRHTDVIALP